MKINLGGIVPLSTVDWIGRASLVVFLRGCPLRCPHCQNQELQSGESMAPYHVIASKIVSQVKGEMRIESAFVPKPLQIDLNEASERVRSKPFVNALVLSGGEPLMQYRQCARLFRLAKSLKLCTGLETSGCYPDRLRELLNKDLPDKVFLDIKAAFHEQDYERATAKSGLALSVLESLKACMENGVALDVRTTIFPEMPSALEVTEIAKKIAQLESLFPNNGLGSLILQQGRPRDGEPSFEPVTLDYLNCMAKAAEDMVNVKIKVASKAKLEKVDNL